MESIRDTIEQYRESCRIVRERINWLSEKITKTQREGGAVRDLLERRYMLYSQLADMQYSISAMEQYLEEKEPSRLRIAQ